jgi:CubicO group peptidase (beta-lactamase class C family)
MRSRCPHFVLLSGFIFLAWVGSAHAQAPWLAERDLTWQELTAWIEGPARGYRLINLDGYNTGGAVRFAALAVKNANRFAWYYHVGALDHVRKKDAEYRSMGCRLISVSGFLRGNEPAFAGIWLKDGRSLRTKMALQLTAKEYEERIKLEKESNFMPKMVSGWSNGADSYRFTALFVPAAGSVWEEQHDLTAEQYQKAIDDCETKGVRPKCVSVYPTPAGPRFAVVFIKSGPKANWYARHELIPQQFQSEFERMKKEGYRPISVASYKSGDPAGSEIFPEIMRKFMAERGIKAGTLAVSRDGQVLLSRGFGFADAEGRRRIGPNDPMRIASLSKAITAAAIRKLVREGKLSLDCKGFPLLGLKPPPGQQPDPRLNDITVEHLLMHQEGWDRGQGFDPMFRPLEIAAALKGPAPAGPVDVIRYMMGQPLQFDPGSKTSYSNFGYCVLGRVIEKVSGQTYLGYVKKNILAPLGVQSIDLARSLPKHRNPREPVYRHTGQGRNVLDPQSMEAVPVPDGAIYLEAMDAHGGLIASSRDYLRFLDAYWLNGEPRQGKGRFYFGFGKLPGTFTMALQRPNGVNVAAFFNQSADPSGLDYFKIREQMREAADQQSGGLRYAAVWVKIE